MFNFFYNFYNKPLAYNLYTRDTEDGTPSPPESQQLIDQIGEDLTDQTGVDLISNS